MKIQVLVFKLEMHHLGKRFALIGVLAQNIRRGLSSKGVSVGDC
jgi:hypothetical protein